MTRGKEDAVEFLPGERNQKIQMLSRCCAFVSPNTVGWKYGTIPTEQTRTVRMRADTELHISISQCW